MGLAGLSYIHLVEPVWFELNREIISLTDLDSRKIRILHLSDLHADNDSALDRIERAFKIALEQKPDIICLTGDYITSRIYDPERYRRALKFLSSSSPTFASIGNHDGGRWAETYSRGYQDIELVKNLLIDSGINFLHNEERQQKIRDRSVSVVGLGDLWARDLKPDLVLEEKRDEKMPIILMSHNPDSKKSLLGYDWDLILSGHTHGGQLKVPFLGLHPFAPIEDKRFVEGLHQWEKGYIHVTRGIGSLHGVRLNCRPQVSIIDLII